MNCMNATYLSSILQTENEDVGERVRDIAVREIPITTGDYMLPIFVQCFELAEDKS